MAQFGPEDPSLWLTRKLGYWEAQIFGNMDHTSHCDIVMNVCLKADHIDPDWLAEAHRALCYNQPNFRTHVERGEDGGIYFIPATDFSDIFEFVDESGATDGVTGYAGCWEFAEKLVNRGWVFGTGKPFIKTYLIKRPDCYILLNKYHHGVGDGTTGNRIVNELLRQYDLLQSGKELDLSPVTPLISAEDMSKCVQNDKLVEDWIENRVERAKTQEILLPLNKEEVAASQAGKPWINRTLHSLGTAEGMFQLKALCKKLGVTVGSHSFAVLFHAVAAVHVRRKGGEFPEGGIPTIYSDVVGNLRSRVEPNPGECFMLCIAELEIKEKIERDTKLLNTTRNISQQLKKCLGENRLALFAQYKEGLETGKHSKVFNSYPGGSYSEFLPSNMVTYSYPTKFSWGEVTSAHLLGAYWCPFFSNQVVLYQSVNGVMNYVVTCCDGESHVKDAGEVLELFVKVMENSDRITEETTVMDLLGF
ncbi:hypothetical protein ACHWQZ_G014020 [Mnemiopsis leidyi]